MAACHVAAIRAVRTAHGVLGSLRDALDDANAKLSEKMEAVTIGDKEAEDAPKPTLFSGPAAALVQASRGDLFGDLMPRRDPARRRYSSNMLL